MWTERGTGSRCFLWLLVKKSAAAVRRGEVEKGVSERSMSSLQLLRCLELHWCSVPTNRLDFPHHQFHPDFFHKCRQKIYLQFVFLIADFFLEVPRRVQETHYCRWMCVVVVWRHLFWKQVFISQMGIGTGPGMVYGQAPEFFFLRGSLQRTRQVELSAGGESCRSLVSKR